MEDINIKTVLYNLSSEGAHATDYEVFITSVIITLIQVAELT